MGFHTLVGFIIEKYFVGFSSTRPLRLLELLEYFFLIRAGVGAACHLGGEEVREEVPEILRQLHQRGVGLARVGGELLLLQPELRSVCGCP